MDESNKPSGKEKVIHLKEAKFNELGKVPFMEILDALDRTSMLIGSSILVGAIVSFPLGIATFFALRYIGLKIDQIVENRS